MTFSSSSSAEKSTNEKLIDSQIPLTKRQRLKWAFENTEIESFYYYEKDSEHRLDSSELAKDIISSFQKDDGLTVCIRDLYTKPFDIDSLKEFHDKFKNQLHHLTGVKPRFEKSFLKGIPVSIYYS